MQPCIAALAQPHLASPLTAAHSGRRQGPPASQSRSTAPAAAAAAGRHGLASCVGAAMQLACCPWHSCRGLGTAPSMQPLHAEPAGRQPRPEGLACAPVTGTSGAPNTPWTLNWMAPAPGGVGTWLMSTVARTQKPVVSAQAPGSLKGGASSCTAPANLRAAAAAAAAAWAAAGSAHAPRKRCAGAGRGCGPPRQPHHSRYFGARHRGAGAWVGAACALPHKVRQGVGNLLNAHRAGCSRWAGPGRALAVRRWRRRAAQRPGAGCSACKPGKAVPLQSSPCCAYWAAAE